jgi:serine/threonine-protein phosphatase 2A regulatory subunit B
MSPAKGVMLMSSSVLTGSYHNYFRIYDVQGDNDIVLQADKSAFKAKKIGGARGKVPGKKEGLQTDNIDFTKKIVSHPPHCSRSQADL